MCVGVPYLLSFNFGLNQAVGLGSVIVLQPVLAISRARMNQEAQLRYVLLFLVVIGRLYWGENLLWWCSSFLRDE